MVKQISVLLMMVIYSLTVHAESTCFGSTAKGRLKNGVELSATAKNVEAYSSLGQRMGRTYVHSTVKESVTEAYEALYRDFPEKVFKFAETGFKDGGRFAPHKTHQNGLSVDFMVPVKLSNGESVHLPTHVFNKFGYDIEFDKQSQYDRYTLDYEAMAAHLFLLDKAIRSKGHRLRRVIFDPELQPNLFKTKPYGGYLKHHLHFSVKRSWVRHDEHYHVDFDIPCQQ